MSKTKQVKLRLPQSAIDQVKRAARTSGITPTQAFNFMLAMHLENLKEPRNG